MVRYKDIPDEDLERLQVVVHRDIKRKIDYLSVDRRISRSELVNEILSGVLGKPGRGPRRRKLTPST